MKDTLHYIITQIVNNPKDVTIEEQSESDSIHFIIHVATDDIGKIIGKEGKVIRALRNVMKIPAIKQGKRISLSLAETSDQPS